METAPRQRFYEITVCAECGQRVEIGGQSDDWLPLATGCPRRCGTLLKGGWDSVEVPGVETLHVQVVEENQK